MHRRGWWVVILATGISLAWAEPTMFADNQSAMPRSAVSSTSKGQVQMILAIESRYAPYFKKGICETDFLTRIQPLITTVDSLSVMELTPEGQRRWAARMKEIWREIYAALPSTQRPPFSALEFSSAIRDGQMDRQRLAHDIANHVGEVCPERLPEVSSDAADRLRWLERHLLVVFEQLIHQGGP